MLGLDNAGKTTILTKLKTTFYYMTVPTLGEFSFEKIRKLVKKKYKMQFTKFQKNNNQKLVQKHDNIFE